MTTKAKGSLDDLPKTFARFRADYLHALRAILDLAEDRYFERQVGLTIEPAKGGGVLLIATDGHVLAVLHDKAGRANKPFRAILPKAFRARAAPPEPVSMYWEGSFAYEPPEWMQPGDVLLHPAGALILGKTRHPSEHQQDNGAALAHVLIETGNHWRDTDFRVDETEPLNWRAAFAGPRAKVERGFLLPEYFAVFAPIFDLAGTSGPTSVAIEFAETEIAPAIVTMRGFDNFIGAISPMRRFEPSPRPAFLTERFEAPAQPAAPPAPTSPEQAQ